MQQRSQRTRYYTMTPHEAMNVPERKLKKKRILPHFHEARKDNHCEKGTCRLLGPRAGALEALYEGHRTAAADAAYVHARRVRVLYL